VWRARAGRHDQEDITLARLAWRLDSLVANVQRFIDHGASNLVEPLREPLEVDWGQLGWLGLVLVVHPDDQHATIDCELGHVTGVLLVGALSVVQLALKSTVCRSNSSP
jgi:hypothetical protein